MTQDSDKLASQPSSEVEDHVDANASPVKQKENVPSKSNWSKLDVKLTLSKVDSTSERKNKLKLQDIVSATLLARRHNSTNRDNRKNKKLYERQLSSPLESYKCGIVGAISSKEQFPVIPKRGLESQLSSSLSQKLKTPVTSRPSSPRSPGPGMSTVSSSTFSKQMAKQIISEALCHKEIKSQCMSPKLYECKLSQKGNNLETYTQNSPHQPSKKAENFPVHLGSAGSYKGHYFGNYKTDTGDKGYYFGDFKGASAN